MASFGAKLIIPATNGPVAISTCSLQESKQPPLQTKPRSTPTKPVPCFVEINWATLRKSMDESIGVGSQQLWKRLWSLLRMRSRWSVSVVKWLPEQPQQPRSCCQLWMTDSPFSTLKLLITLAWGCWVTRTAGLALRGVEMSEIFFLAFTHIAPIAVTWNRLWALNGFARVYKHVSVTMGIPLSFCFVCPFRRCHRSIHTQHLAQADGFAF